MSETRIDHDNEHSRETRTQYGDAIYWHINNGGISFRLEQRHYESKQYPTPPIEGPVLHITAMHFGCITNGLELPTNKDSLRALGQLLLQYADDPSMPETTDCAEYGAHVVRRVKVLDRQEGEPVTLVDDEDDDEDDTEEDVMSIVDLLKDC